MKRRILSILLAVIMIVSLFPAVIVSAAVEHNDDYISAVSELAEESARNIDTGKDYETLAEALDKAGNGETVVLLKDVDEGDATHVVKAGVTLDLNGFDLTSDITLAFGTIKDSGANGYGKLIVAKDQLVYSGDKKDVTASSTASILPVWQEDGYIFCPISGFYSKWSDKEEWKYMFAPESDDIEAILAEDSEVKLYLEIQYKKKNSETYQTMIFVVSDELQKLLHDGPTGCIIIKLNGTENIAEVKARGYVKAEQCSFSLGCDNLCYIIPGTEPEVSADISLDTYSEAFDLLPENIRIYVNTAKSYDTSDYTNTVSDQYITDLWAPNPVTLEWSYTNASEVEGATVKISQGSDLSDAKEYSVNDNSESIAVSNLLSGTDYYWSVTAELSNGKSISSPVGTFSTLDGTRPVYIDGIANSRDVGGHKTSDNKVMKQGLVYRSTEMQYNYTITDEGIKTALEELGIKTDLDLRGLTEHDVQYFETPLGDDVQYLRKSATSYSSYINHPLPSGQIFKLFADIDNYPILFHCVAGADRTGTLALMLQGLCGVPENDLITDYELTVGRYRNSDASSAQNFAGFIELLKSESGATLQDKIYNFFHDKANVSTMALSNIYNILMTDSAIFDYDYIDGFDKTENGYSFKLIMRGSKSISSVTVKKKAVPFTVKGDTVTIETAISGKGFAGVITFDDGSVLKFEPYAKWNGTTNANLHPEANTANGTAVVLPENTTVCEMVIHNTYHQYGIPQNSSSIVDIWDSGDAGCDRGITYEMKLSDAPGFTEFIKASGNNATWPVLSSKKACYAADTADCFIYNGKPGDVNFGKTMSANIGELFEGKIVSAYGPVSESNAYIWVGNLWSTLDNTIIPDGWYTFVVYNNDKTEAYAFSEYVVQSALEYLKYYQYKPAEPEVNNPTVGIYFVPSRYYYDGGNTSQNTTHTLTCAAYNLETGTMETISFPSEYYETGCFYEVVNGVVKRKVVGDAEGTMGLVAKDGGFKIENGVVKVQGNNFLTYDDSSIVGSRFINYGDYPGTLSTILHYMNVSGVYSYKYMSGANPRYTYDSTVTVFYRSDIADLDRYEFLFMDERFANTSQNSPNQKSETIVYVDKFDYENHGTDGDGNNIYTFIDVTNGKSIIVKTKKSFTYNKFYRVNNGEIVEKVVPGAGELTTLKAGFSTSKGADKFDITPASGNAYVLNSASPNPLNFYTHWSGTVASSYYAFTGYTNTDKYIIYYSGGKYTAERAVIFWGFKSETECN